jgi:uncharacterized membrane protein YcaP (DUF421 family)
MDAVIRGLVIYFFLLVVFRVAGRRTLSQSTSFDLVLLLIISETTQEALLDNDHSITHACLLILTLVGASIVLSFIKIWFPTVEKWMDGTPVLIVENGRMHQDRMRRMRIDANDILVAARRAHGLERMDQIKYAIVEGNGEITIVAAQSSSGRH